MSTRPSSKAPVWMRAVRIAVTTAAFGTLIAWPAAGQGDEDQPPPEKRTSTTLFNDCLAQEKLGDACSCWRLYQKKYPSAAPGEAAVSETKIQKCGDKPKPADAPKQVAPTYPQRTADDAKCYLGLKMEGAPSAILNDLVTKCGAPAGMLKMTPVLSGTQRSDDQPEKFLIHLDKDECYRFFAVGDSGITALQVGFLDLDDRLIAGDTEDDRIKVMPPQKAFCPKDSGVFKLAVSVTMGGGRYVMQGWKRPASSQMAGPAKPNSALLDP